MENDERIEDTRVQKALAETLRQGDVAARREAAAELLARVRSGHDITWAMVALLEARSDPDGAVRLAASRAVVRKGLGWTASAVVYVEQFLTSDEPELRQAATNALLRAAQSRERGQVASLYLPLFVRALSEATQPDVREGLLTAIQRAAGEGADMTAALPSLTAALGDPSPVVARKAATALRHIALQGVDIGAARPGLEAGLSSPDIQLQYACARTLAAWAVATGDGALADRLTGHPSDVVREGALFGPRRPVAQRGGRVDSDGALRGPSRRRRDSRPQGPPGLQGQRRRDGGARRARRVGRR